MPSGARTRIQLCGRFVLELDGRRVDAHLPSRQGRLLFAYLALNRNHAATREELVDALWPYATPAAAPSALSVLVSKVRAALGNQTLSGRGELRLNLPPDARIDVENRAARGRTRRPTPARALAATGDRLSRGGNSCPAGPRRPLRGPEAA